MLKSFVEILFLLTFFFSCTPATQNSLLSMGGEGSSTSSSENQTSITGTPSVNTDGINTAGGKVLASGIENGDLLEVSGECSDLGYKKNRILFQVYENTTENGFPLIDNAIDWKCQASTATTELSSGNETCFVPTQGLGVVEDLQITPQYPQCFNKRFSFFVRLGRAMRQDPLSSDYDDATNPRVSYLLKVKLRLLGDGTQVTDSPWEKITVNRVVSKPTAKITLNALTNKIELDVAKFSNIKYNAFYSAAGPSYLANNTVSGSLFSGCTITTVSGTGAVSTSCSQINSDAVPSSTVAGEITHYNLLPGITYAYQFMAEDLNYVYPSASGTETSGYGLAVGQIAAPTVIGFITRTQPGAVQCVFTLSNKSSFGNHKVEWAYSTTDPSWMIATPTVFTASCGNVNPCTVTTPVGTPLHMAVRSYLEVSGVRRLTSDWSPPDYEERTNICQ